MMAFVVHKGGRGTTPPIDPPAPPKRKPVARLTEPEITEALRKLRYHLERRPELHRFHDALCAVYDHQLAAEPGYEPSADAVDSDHFDRVLAVLTGRWDDEQLADVLAYWPLLKRRTREAIASLAHSGKTPLETALRSALDRIYGLLSPTGLTEIAAHVAHAAARVNAKRTTETAADARTARTATITAALEQMTDDEIAALAPLAAALVDRGEHRPRNVRNAFTRALASVFDRADWARIAMSAIRRLQHPADDDGEQE